MDTANRRPELRAGTAGGADASQRILSNLEHGGVRPAQAVIARRPSRWQLDGWTVVLMVMLGLLSLLVWMTREGQIEPRKYSRSNYSTHGGYHNAAPTAPVAAVTEEAPANSTATIVNLPALAAQERDRIAQHTARQPQPASSARPALASAVTMAEPKAAAPARKPASSASAQSASAGADSDVTLLTALVEHANKPPTPPAPNRDVVERQDGDSTATLLARCRQLGLIESLLCRSRICSGRWEHEAACRAAN